MDQEKTAAAAAREEAPQGAEPQGKEARGKKPQEKKAGLGAYLALGIVGLLVAGLMFFLGISTILEQRLEDFDRTGMYDGYSKIDVVMASDAFYERTDGATLHMAVDKQMNINIICVGPEQLEQLQPVLNSNLSEVSDLRSVKPVTLQGRHKAILNNMHHAVVQAYNTMMDTDKMTYGGAVRVVGELYLDTTEPPTTRSPWLYLVLGLAVAALSLYFVIYAAVMMRRRRSRSGHTTKEDPRLSRYDVRVGYEVQSGVALTANMVADLSDAESLPVMIPFKRILWMYASQKKGRLGGGSQTIVLGLDDGSTREIASLPTAGAGNQIYLEIFSDLRDRIPGVLVGYSEENETAYQEKVAALKEQGLEEQDETLDLLPEGDGTTNQITGQWQEGEDILPQDWDPEAVEKTIEEEQRTEEAAADEEDGNQ